MHTSDEYQAIPATPPSGITAAGVCSFQKPRFGKTVLLAVVTVATLALVVQMRDHTPRRTHARAWISLVRAPNVEASPQAPLTYDSWVGTGHCDYGFSCRVHLFMTRTANETLVRVGYQIQSLLENVVVPSWTRGRIAQMSDKQVASIALQLVTHVSQELEQPVCGVNIDVVKQAVKDTASAVLQKCTVTTETAACYPQREVLRFASVSLQKNFMLPTRQCSRRRYCRAVLEVHSVNNCMSTSAGYKIFSVDELVRNVDRNTKKRVGGTTRAQACQWANTLIRTMEEDLVDFGCALDADAVCDGMLAGAKGVLTCTRTDQDACLNVTAVGCV